MNGEEMTPGEMRVARMALGLSRAALAQQLGVTERAVHYWEAGKRRIPRSATLLLAMLTLRQKRAAKR